MAWQGAQGWKGAQSLGHGSGNEVRDPGSLAWGLVAAREGLGGEREERKVGVRGGIEKKYSQKESEKTPPLWPGNQLSVNRNPGNRSGQSWSQVGSAGVAATGSRAGFG